MQLRTIYHSFSNMSHLIFIFIDKYNLILQVVEDIYSEIDIAFDISP